MKTSTFPTVAITLDKERHMRLTLKGMLWFEDHTGKSLVKGFKLSDMEMADNAALIFACLCHEDKELTFDDVCSMIDINNILEVMTAVHDCLNISTPEATGGPLPEKSPPG